MNVATVNRAEILKALGIIKEIIKPDTTENTDPSKYVIIQHGRIHCISNQFMLVIPSGLNFDARCIDVEFALLYDYLRKLKEKEIMVGVTPNGTLGVKAGDKSRVEFAIRDDIDFDEEYLETDEDNWHELPESFVTAMQYTAWASDKSDNQYSHVAVNDGKMYGYNGRDRFACFDMKQQGKDAFAIKETVFIHSESLTFVQKYMAIDPMKGKPKYCIKNGWLHMRTADGVIFSSRTRSDNAFDATYMEGVLDPGTTPVFRINKSVEEAMDRANPFSGNNNKVKRVTVHICNTIKTKTETIEAPPDISYFVLTAVREDGSRIYERCDIPKVNEVIRFTVNFKLLESLIKYGEYFRIYDGKLTVIGSTDNGTPTGNPLFKAIAVLYEEE